MAANSRLYLPILLAVTTGMRRGEILGLRWKDADLTNRRISVRQSMGETRKYGIEIKSPKTEHGKRSIKLPNITLEGLKQHKSKVSELRLQLGTGLDKDHLVFEELPGKIFKPSQLTSAYRHFTKKHELKTVTFHDLRHTHATHLLEGNIHPKVVSERLGHSTIAITLDTYSHVLPNMQEEAANIVDEVLQVKKH